MQVGRRALLKHGSLWLAAASIPALAADKPVLRFGVVTDVHYADKPERINRYYRESLGKLREGAEEFRSADFAVELGDLVDAADDLDTERAWLTTAVREFRSAGVPTHYVLGNHCIQTLTKKQFLADVDRDRGYYSFDQSGVRCIVLDACYRRDGVSYDAGNFDWKDTDIPAEERQWLKEQLASTSGKAIVFVHQRVDVPGVHTVASSGEVRRILSESRKVLAVLQGHSHKNEYHEVDEVHYCTMRAVVEGSGAENSGYSLVSVYGDGRVQVKGFRAQQAYNLNADALKPRRPSRNEHQP